MDLTPLYNVFKRVTTKSIIDSKHGPEKKSIIDFTPSTLISGVKFPSEEITKHMPGM